MNNIIDKNTFSKKIIYFCVVHWDNMDTIMKKYVRARLIEPNPLDKKFKFLISSGSLFNLSGSYYIYENRSPLFYQVYRQRSVEDAWKSVGTAIQKASRKYSISSINKLLQD